VKELSLSIAFPESSKVYKVKPETYSVFGLGIHFTIAVIYIPAYI
jgi:hypothetical protein